MISIIINFFKGSFVARVLDPVESANLDYSTLYEVLAKSK